jgi:hypothetical protein
MSNRDAIWQERRLEEILFANTDAASKVQQVMRLGFDEEIAGELVERHEIGSQMPIYYETLEFDAEYDESLSEREAKDNDAA